MKKFTFFLAAAAALAFVNGCTPEQLNTYEKLTGVEIPSSQMETLLALPDNDIIIGDTIIHADGSTEKMIVPPKSRCPQYYDEALRAGWTAAQWPRIDYIIFRESRCNNTAYNGKGRDNSYGLMQLNMKALKSWVGPLVDWDFTRLYDPYTNLHIAKVLYGKAMDAWGCGWKPWAFRC